MSALNVIMPTFTARGYPVLRRRLCLRPRCDDCKVKQDASYLLASSILARNYPEASFANLVMLVERKRRTFFSICLSAIAGP